MGSEVVVELFVALLAIAVGVALVTQRLSIPYSVALVDRWASPSRSPSRPPTPASPPTSSSWCSSRASCSRRPTTSTSRTFDALRVRRHPRGAGRRSSPRQSWRRSSPRPPVSTSASPSSWAPSSARPTPSPRWRVFKKLRAPEALGTVVEAESLLNDGTGVVLFTIALAGASRRPCRSRTASSRFVAGHRGQRRAGRRGRGTWPSASCTWPSDHTVQVMVSLVAAYGTYLAADALHQSGIIATVVVGIVIGNAGGRYALPAATTEALDTVWDAVAFLLTALVFLLIGIVITPAQLAARRAGDRRRLRGDHAWPARGGGLRPHRRRAARCWRAPAAGRRVGGLPARDVLGGAAGRHRDRAGARRCRRTCRSTT